MKKSSSNILSVLKLLGITPQVGIILILGIFLSGIVIGLFVRNSSKKPVVKKAPVHKTSIKKEITPPLTKANIPHTNIIRLPNINIHPPSKIKEKDKYNPYRDSQFLKNSLVVNKDIRTPVIAIIVDDMGIDMVRSQHILKMPYPLTVSFLSYAPNLQSQINRAKEMRKEVMLHIPMEALNDIYDYGPSHLSTKLSHSDNIELLKTLLKKATGYIGINNHMGSRFTEDLSQLKRVMEEVHKQGLAFIDSRTTPNSKADKIAKEIKLPYGSRDIFLDDSNDEQDIQKSLILLERIAKKRGYAIAIAHPRDNSIKALQDWLPSLKSRGLTLVPVSYIIKNKK